MAQEVSEAVAMVHENFTPLCDSELHRSQQSLNSSIDDELHLLDYHHPQTSKLKIATAFLAGFVAASFLFILRQAFIGHHIPSAIASRPTLPLVPNTIDPLSGKPKAWFSGPCAQYTNSAEIANCTFDLLSLSWFPAHYLDAADREGEREFLAVEDWKYELEDGTEVVDINAFSNRRLSDNQDEKAGYKEPQYIYTSGRWHRIHCAFMFERLQRRLSKGETVDSYMASSGHGEHCKHIMVKAEEEWEWERKGAEVRTRVFIKYPYLI